MEIGSATMFIVLIDKAKLVGAHLRFYKHYLVARRRQVELKSIEIFVRDRLERQFVDEQVPLVDVKMQLLKRWKKVSGITFDAPIAVIATMNAVPAFGMAFEVRGKEIRIRQLHGVRGFSTRGRYHPVHAWPRLFVQSCQDMALKHGYSRVLVVRSHRSYSWKRLDSGYAPGTPEGIRQHSEIRLRLVKRLDGTAQSIPGFEKRNDWWVWRASWEKFRGEQGRKKTGISVVLKTWAATRRLGKQYGMDVGCAPLRSGLGKTEDHEHSSRRFFAIEKLRQRLRGWSW